MLVLLAMLGCGGGGPAEKIAPIPNTTTRIGRPEVKDGTELDLKIFTTPADCNLAVLKEYRKQCLPHVDRASGEVRLSFQLRLSDGEPYPLPLTSDHVEVSHQGTHVSDEMPGLAFSLIPHEPQRAKQLFILVIDASASMRQETRPGSGVTRMEAVRSALLLKDVKEAFFPGAVKTAVVVFEFTSGDPQPLGGKLELLENAQSYTKLIKTQLQARSGFTHLYDAVRYATGSLLQQEQINNWLQIQNAEPTVIVLTDGFNNVRGDDVCSDNARRLSRLLEHLRSVRQGSVASNTRPTVYTVGLGRPIRPNFSLPKLRKPEVDDATLCGRRYVDRRIDGDLEEYGIDNPSLMWIADFGGGTSYVRRNKKGLGEAFKAAAAERYIWFEARYRVPPFFLRRAFETRLELKSFATASAKVNIYPSAWLDAPPGITMADGWSFPSPYRQTLTVVLPVLGLLTLLSYLGAAWFNTRRVLFGRTRPPRPPRE